MLMVQTSGAEESRRPDIVIFLTDDLSLGDCSIYNPQCGIRTPNMERVAREGLTFNLAFVASPSCAPSRGALLTGVSPARNGAMFNHTVPEQRFKRWPAYFQELGYEVVAIGKVAHYETVRQYGFDHCSHFKYHQDECIDEAIAWLEKRTSGKPLCLFVGSNWPHVPWPEKHNYPPERLPLPPTFVDTPETREFRARYAAAVENADRDLGKVYDAMRKQMPAETLFLFTSDNGSQFPFGKWNCYDAGVHMPLVAVWPGKVAAGKRTDAMVTWEDILPTCIEAARGTPPACGTGPGEITGRSFLGVLRGQTSEHRTRIFATHSGDGNMNEYPIRSVRSPEWRYIRNLDPKAEHHTHVDKAVLEKGRAYWLSWERKAAGDSKAAAIVKRYHTRQAEELYNVKADPYEQQNLASDATMAKVLDQFRGELNSWMKSQDDRGLETEKERHPKPKKPAQAAPAK